jgi:hypothetical protein
MELSSLAARGESTTTAILATDPEIKEPPSKFVINETKAALDSHERVSRPVILEH